MVPSRPWVSFWMPALNTRSVGPPKTPLPNRSAQSRSLTIARPCSSRSVPRKPPSRGSKALMRPPAKSAAYRNEPWAVVRLARRVKAAPRNGRLGSLCQGWHCASLRQRRRGWTSWPTTQPQYGPSDCNLFGSRRLPSASPPARRSAAEALHRLDARTAAGVGGELRGQAAPARPALLVDLEQLEDADEPGGVAEPGGVSVGRVLRGA